MTTPLRIDAALIATLAPKHWDPRNRLVNVDRDKLKQAINETIDRVFDEADAANEKAHKERLDRLNVQAEACNREWDKFWDGDA